MLARTRETRTLLLIVCCSGFKVLNRSREVNITALAAAPLLHLRLIRRDNSLRNLADWYLRQLLERNSINRGNRIRTRIRDIAALSIRCECHPVRTVADRDGGDPFEAGQRKH